MAGAIHTQTRGESGTPMVRGLQVSDGNGPNLLHDKCHPHTNVLITRYRLYNVSLNTLSLDQTLNSDWEKIKSYATIISFLFYK